MQSFDDMHNSEQMELMQANQRIINLEKNRKNKIEYINEKIREKRLEQEFENNFLNLNVDSKKMEEDDKKIRFLENSKLKLSILKQKKKPKKNILIQERENEREK